MSKNVVALLSSGRCPICVLFQQDELDGLCSWVVLGDEEDKESVQRIHLLRSQGFCNYHFWKFQRMNTFYGNASVGIQLIEQAIKTLMKSRQFFSQRQGYDQKNDHIKKDIYSQKNSRCPLCMDLEKKEYKHLKDISFALREAGCQKLYYDGTGLCLPHFIKILNLIEDDDLLQFLVEAEIDQMQRIGSAARGLLAKREPSLSVQQTRNEKNSGYQAIEKITGCRGVRVPGSPL